MVVRGGHAVGTVQLPDKGVEEKSHEAKVSFGVPRNACTVLLYTGEYKRAVGLAGTPTTTRPAIPKRTRQSIVQL